MLTTAGSTLVAVAIRSCGSTSSVAVKSIIEPASARQSRSRHFWFLKRRTPGMARRRGVPSFTRRRPVPMLSRRLVAAGHAPRPTRCVVRQLRHRAKCSTSWKPTRSSSAPAASARAVDRVRREHQAGVRAAFSLSGSRSQGTVYKNRVQVRRRRGGAECTTTTCVVRAHRENPVAQATKVDRVLVQPMVSGLGEVLVGYRVDPDVATGDARAGGHIRWRSIATQLRLAPGRISAEAQAMIGEVAALKALAGYRGKPAGDLDALAKALVALSQLCRGRPGRRGS